MAEVKREYVLTYSTNQKCFEPGLKPNQVTQLYSKWSKNYNQLMAPGTYNGPLQASEEVGGLVSPESRSRVRVLDVAAGTGLLGMHLHSMGFTKVDALEPAEGMLTVLRDTGAYSTAYQEFLGHGKSTIPDGTYDIVASVGGMGEGHMPVSSVEDMIRITKKGGVVVIVMRREYLHTVAEYKDRFEPYLTLLEKRGVWQRVTQKVTKNYFCEKDGMIFSYRVL